MSNAWWYGAITIAFIIPFAYTMWKVPDKKLVAVFTFMAGVTYSAEYVVLVLLEAYRYHPHVMQDPYFDSIVGAIVSDAVSIPMTSVIVAAFQLGWKWMIILSGIIVGVEAFFVRLGLYQHAWWKLPYTFVGFLAWSVLAKFVYSQLRARVTNWLRWLVLFYTNTLVQSSVVFVLVSVFHAYHYEIGWFQDKTRDHLAFSTAYILLFSAIFSSLVTFHVKWVWRLAVILLFLPLNWVLDTYGILHMSGWWSLGHFAILRLVHVAVLDTFNRHVLQEPS